MQIGVVVLGVTSTNNRVDADRLCKETEKWRRSYHVL